jgi:hypothetical protein
LNGEDLPIELLDPAIFNQSLQRRRIAKIIRPVHHLLGHRAAFGKLFQNSLDPAIRYCRHPLEQLRIDLDGSLGDLRIWLPEPLIKNFLGERAVFLYEVNGLDIR